jgi:acyl dehydratase
MPDPAHVGRRYQAAGQIIDPARASQFARAIAGGDQVAELGPIPPTYAAVYCLFPTFGQIFLDPEVGLDLAGLVHGEQSFEFHTAPVPGETVDATAEIVGLAAKRGRWFITVTMEAHRPSGEQVVSGRALLIAAGAPA